MGDHQPSWLESAFWGKERKGRRPMSRHPTFKHQAMKTAMKASKNMRIAPPTGKTMGMKGTMDSTTSVCCSGC